MGKNEFYTHKIGDYLRVIPHKGCLTMVKNKHSAYILQTFGKDPFYRVNTTSTTTHKTTEQTSSEKNDKMDYTRFHTNNNHKARIFNFLRKNHPKEYFTRKNDRSSKNDNSFYEGKIYKFYHSRYNTSKNFHNSHHHQVFY